MTHFDSVWIYKHIIGLSRMYISHKKKANANLSNEYKNLKMH